MARSLLFGVIALGLLEACRGWEGDVVSRDGGDGGNEGAPVPDVLAECATAARNAFTLDAAGNLSRFDPRQPTVFLDSRRLTCVDRGDCSGRARGPGASLSLDRHGTLWVLDCHGALWTVAPGATQCASTKFVASPQRERFQMAFAIDPVDGKERLFIASAVPETTPVAVVRGELARLALDDFVAQPIGALMGWPALVGTEAGELWGIFPLNTTLGAASRLALLDPGSGSEVRSTPTTPWAFGLDSETAPPCLFAAGEFWCFGHNAVEPAVSVLVRLGRDGLGRNLPDAPEARLDRRVVAATSSICPFQ